jgi:hypothetical protein
MGFTEVLTIVLVVLNATHNIHISWWLAFAPELAAAALYLIILAVAVLVGKAVR